MKLSEQCDKPFGFVYLITNKVNGRVYVGQTVTGIKKRWHKHVSSARKERPYPISQAIKKHGEGSFSIEVIAICFNRVELDEQERFYIKELNSKCPNGYNLTDGGIGTSGYKQTREQVEKMIASRVGYVASIETRNKISASIKGVKKSMEHNLKVGLANKGKKRTECFCKNMRDRRKGVRLPHMIRAVVARKENGDEEYFSCISDGAKKYSILNSSISNCLKGLTKTAGGIKWTYTNK